MGTESISDAKGGSFVRKRTRMVRSYPIHTLEDALTVALAVQESNAGLPFDRTLLARAMGTTPASSGFTMKVNSSAKYGLTQGGYNDALISLTRLGEAIVAPRGDEEFRQALVEAATQPDVFGQFYRMLDGKRLPEDAYAQNMLQREFGIHPDLTSECLGIIKANGLYAGILREAEEVLYITLQRPQEPGCELEEAGHGAISDTPAEGDTQPSPQQVAPPSGKIFIGHGGNAGVVQFVKGLLDDFGIPYGSVEEEGKDTQPVPVRVSSEMRRCTSAILVFANDDADNRVGERMLYQLGAASVLYGDKVVILSEAGFAPANAIPDVHRVMFRSEKPEDAGLALLLELHNAGIIRVTT